MRNRVTSSALPPNTTPHHKWMGNAPTLSPVRVFGSKCWYTLPKIKVQKLDIRAREAMFGEFPPQPTLVRERLGSRGYMVDRLQELMLLGQLSPVQKLELSMVLDTMSRIVTNM